MVSISLRDPHVLGTLAASVLCIGGVAAWLALRRRPSPEEMERERRAHLVRAGRIIDGTILDFSEIQDFSEMEAGEPAEAREIRFILYKYEIGGVAYECSQEVTALGGYMKPEDLRLGFPCSVRYDVRRPENSIVLAENWSGLRQTARSVPTRKITPPRKPRSSPPAKVSRHD
ncbi:MAG TPA: hypothetical protein VMD92_12125 [Acidobacteriaceae bacterium]|jgi:hypothetical protein|nr:hypothetical protein [Acidobacteriaceae bacterium]